MTRILIVDDQALFREGLRTLLSTRPDMDVVGEAGDGVRVGEAGIEDLDGDAAPHVHVFSLVDGGAAAAVAEAAKQPISAAEDATGEVDRRSAAAWGARCVGFATSLGVGHSGGEQE